MHSTIDINKVYKNLEMFPEAKNMTIHGIAAFVYAMMTSSPPDTDGSPMCDQEPSAVYVEACGICNPGLPNAFNEPIIGRNSYEVDNSSVDSFIHTIDGQAQESLDVQMGRCLWFSQYARAPKSVNVMTSVVRKRLNTAPPKEPVPPVIRIFLSVNMINASYK